MKNDFINVKVIISVILVMILSYQAAIVIQEPMIKNKSNLLSVAETSLNDLTNSYNSKVSNTKQGLIPHDPIVIQSNADLELIASSGDGTFNDPYIIENLRINSSSAGINISGTSQNFIIRNCEIESEGHCITILNGNSGDIVIDNNVFLSNTSYGIDIGNNDGIIIENNVIVALAEGYCAININNCPESLIFNNYCVGGIKVRSSALTNLTNNSCNTGNYGIYIFTSPNNYLGQNNCSNNELDGIYSYCNYEIKIINNICSRNNGSGISITGYLMNDRAVISENICRYNKLEGINIYRLNISDIEMNSCDGNKGNGISIMNSNNCNVSENILFYNLNNGILLHTGTILFDIYNNYLSMHYYGVNFQSIDCRNNIIRFNIFAVDQYAKRRLIGNALDNGESNTWFGNYWYDYNGEGSYLIAGTANSTDPMPIKREEDISNIDLFDISSVIESGYNPNNINQIWSQIFDPASIMVLAIISIEILTLFLLRKHFKLKKVEIDKTNAIENKDNLLADRDLGIGLSNNLDELEK